MLPEQRSTTRIQQSPIRPVPSFDHGLPRLLHDIPHWLDVPERIHWKIGVTVHRCLQSKAPKYHTDCCTPVSDIASRRHLLSASRHHLSVPRHRLTTFGRRAFSVAARRSETVTLYRIAPETRLSAAAEASDNYFFDRYSAHSALCCNDSALYKNIQLLHWHWHWHWYLQPRMLLILQRMSNRLTFSYCHTFPNETV